MPWLRFLSEIHVNVDVAHITYPLTTSAQQLYYNFVLFTSLRFPVSLPSSSTIDLKTLRQVARRMHSRISAELEIDTCVRGGASTITTVVIWVSTKRSHTASPSIGCRGDVTLCSRSRRFYAAGGRAAAVDIGYGISGTVIASRVAIEGLNAPLGAGYTIRALIFILGGGCGEEGGKGKPSSAGGQHDAEMRL